MTRALLFFATLLCLSSAARSTEWDDLRAQYQFCTVAAGAGLLRGNGNPDEWNFAEGLSAQAAELSEPHMATMDLNGRIFIADKNAHAIRRVDPDGTISTVAGRNRDEVFPNAGFNGDGDARACLLNGPQNVYAMPDGSFYILDSGNFRLRRVDLSGNLTTIITDTVILNRGLWVSRDGQLIYYCTTNALKRWTPAMGNGPGMNVATGFAQTGNIDVDATGNIYVSDRTNCAVYRVPPAYGGGAFTDALRVAGLGTANQTDGGPASSGLMATQVGLLEPRGVAFHPLGGYFVATHRGGDVWYIDSGGLARMFIQGDSGNTHVGGSVAVPTTFNIMSEPRSVSVSRTGDVLIACNDSGIVRIVRNILPLPAAPNWESVQIQANGLRLRWESDPARWYFLERSAGLNASGWSPLAVLPGAAGSTEFTDPGALDDSRGFYRLRSFRAWPN